MHMLEGKGWSMWWQRALVQSLIWGLFLKYNQWDYVRRGLARWRDKEGRGERGSLAWWLQEGAVQGTGFQSHSGEVLEQPIHELMKCCSGRPLPLMRELSGYSALGKVWSKQIGSTALHCRLHPLFQVRLHRQILLHIQQSLPSRAHYPPLINGALDSAGEDTCSQLTLTSPLLPAPAQMHSC